MRKLTWLTIGFALALFVNISFFWDTGSLLFFFGAAAATAFLGLLSVRTEAIRLPALFALGMAVGFGWLGIYRMSHLELLKQVDGQTLSLTVEAASFPEDSRYSRVMEGTTEISGKRFRMQIYLDDGDTVISPGDKLEGDFRLRVTAPGGLKDSTYYQGRGIALIASQKGELRVHPAQKKTLVQKAVVMEYSIQKTISKLFPEDVAPFVKALLLGDTSNLDYRTDSALRISGIRHVAAVSGLHVGVLFGFVVLILGRRRFLTPIVSTFVLFFFAAAVGFTPSVTRACLMTCIMGIALMTQREYDAPNALALAALLMLLYNPFLAVSVSFQLSVCSVAGILLCSSRLYRWIRGFFPAFPGQSVPGRLTRWASMSVSVTVGAMVFTVPLSAYYFKNVSLIGILTNFLTIWIISGIFVGIAVLCAVGTFFPAIGTFGASVLAWPIRYVLWIARTLARFPLAAVYTESKWIVCWLVFCYVLLTVFLMLGRKKPWRYLCLGTAGLVLAVSVSWIQPRLDACRLTVVSVGEGQCILLQSRGERFLIDCGGNSDSNAADSAMAALLSQGVFRLDGIVLTHYDRDHTGALLNLLNWVDATQAYFPDTEDRGYAEQFREETDIPVQKISDNTKIPLGSGTITLFSPGTLKTENENCMCVLFETENCVILITGDRGKSGETHLVREQVLPDVNILIAGHHGSKHSTNDVLLDAVLPETVIISCGAGNSYGHPAPEMLERLTARSCEILRTDTMGTITLRR